MKFIEKKKMSSGSRFSLATLAFKLLNNDNLLPSQCRGLWPSSFCLFVCFCFYLKKKADLLNALQCLLTGHTQLESLLDNFYIFQSKVGETRTCYEVSTMRWALGEIDNLNKGKFAYMGSIREKKLIWLNI